MNDKCVPVAKYRPDIDGLRAVSIVFVVVFHAFPNVFPGGFVGVDVFFVISGFLITGLIAKDLQNDCFSLVDFYAKRIRRIFPSLAVMLASCLLLGWFVLLSKEFSALGKHVAAGSLYVSNFVLQNEAGYFDSTSEWKPLLHLWSLAIEEQFYLLWPLLLIINRKKKKNTILVMVLFFFISFSLNIGYIERLPAVVFYSPLTRAWELVAGALLAYLDMSGLTVGQSMTVSFWRTLAVWLNKRFRKISSALGFVLIFTSVFALDVKVLYPYWYAILPVLGASLVIYAGQDSWINLKLLSAKSVVYIGLVSYPLYIWHWPILYFVRVFSNGSPNQGMKLCALVLALLLALITYKFIEIPIRAMNLLKASKALLVLVLAIGLIGLVVRLNAGFPSRFPELDLKAQNIGSESWLAKGFNSDPACVNKLGAVFEQYCKILDPGKNIDVLLLGDSTANHFYSGLASILQNQSNPVNLANLGKGGCMPLLGVDEYDQNGPRRCDLVSQKSYELALNTPSIKVVLISFAGPLHLAGDVAAHNRSSIVGKIYYSPDIESATPREQLKIAFRNSIRTLMDAKKRVVILLNVPSLDFDPAQCVNLRPVYFPGTKIKSPCGVDRVLADKTNFEFRSMVQELKSEFPSLTVWDPYLLLCDSLICHADNGVGFLFYRDGVHLSEFGSKWIASRLPVGDLNSFINN